MMALYENAVPSPLPPKNHVGGGIRTGGRWREEQWESGEAMEIIHGWVRLRKEYTRLAAGGRTPPLLSPLSLIHI